MNSNTLYNSPQLPRQKLSLKKKDDNWRKSNIDAAIAMTGLYSNSRRSDRSRKQKNYNLINGKIRRADLEYAVNPLGLEVQNFTFPATIQPYDVWSPIFMQLFGEEARRPFSFIVRAINEDAISEKEQELKAQVIQTLQKILTSDKEPDEELTALDKMVHSYQDMRESIATKFLTYLKKDLQLDMEFQKGWEDALVAGEEIYAIEEISNEPRVRRVNPMELHFILPHNSDLIDNADIIVEETYMSVSQIIDNFYEYLTPSEIAALEDGSMFNSSSSVTTQDVLIFERDYTPDFLTQGSPTQDAYGNYKVYKVTWKSKQKVGRVLWLDENNEQQETIVSEQYKPKENEKVEWLWINQYWEGYRIGDSLYKNIKPKRLQFRRMDNISSCKSGYVGAVYNCNNAQSVSLMDRLTPFIYLYVIIWYNTELAISTNIGKIALIDTSLIPDGWEVEKWLHYARIMKIGFLDSYTEGKKGERQGKMNQSQQNRELNLETGNYIQQHISLLQYIESKIKSLAGVPEQRMGDIQASELVGNTERAVHQASFVTEKWFQIHNYNKQRVLEILIETAKSVWSGKSKKLQYISDELTTTFFSVDMNEFINSEFGVFVSNSAKDTEALNTLKQLMQAALQNDKASLSTIIDVLGSESIADTKHKLIQAEEEQFKRQQQLIDQQNQGALQSEQMRLQFETDKLDREDMNKQLDRENDIQVAEIKALGFAKDTDTNDNNIPDVLEIEKLRQKDIIDREKLNLEKQKLKTQQEEAEKVRKHEKELKDKDLKQAKLDNEAKIRIARMKPKQPKKK